MVLRIRVILNVEEDVLRDIEIDETSSMIEFHKAISSFFEGKSKVEKHRIIHQILDYELKNGLHALTLELTHIE